jgi:hypothetical protein
MSNVKNYILSILVTVAFFTIAEGALYLANFEYAAREKAYWQPTITMFEGTRQRNIATQFEYPGYIWRTIANTRFTDSRGFRRPELPDVKGEHKIRIAFLGGSTTHGGFRPYPERAITLLNDALGEDRYEALNAACSSYSTHQSRIALDRWVLPLKPDAVFLYHGWNDPQVQDDGYSDHEKFRTAARNEQSWLSSLAHVRNLRMGMGMAALVDWADFSWPRPRVSPEKFRENLEYMAQQCELAGVPLWVATRPRTQRSDSSRPFYASKTIERQYYGDLLATQDGTEIYDTVHHLYTDLQHEITRQHDNTYTCDLSAFIDQLEQRQLDGQLNPHIKIFREDACHLYEFAEQQMAEFVALTIAPQYRAQIERHIAGFAYNAQTAHQLLMEEQPGGTLYYASKAAAAEPSRAHQLADLNEQAKKNLRFVKLFHEGRPGTEGEFSAKLAKLRTCLEMRPSDFGVAWQIYRLCIYEDRAVDVAEILAPFRPANIADARQWLSISLESHIIGERLKPAVATANQLLRIDPENKEALVFLTRVRDSLGAIENN